MTDQFGSYKRLATAATTVISAYPCHLIGVVVNGGSGGTITLYDDPAAATSGNQIAIIEAIGATNPVSLPYYLVCNRGLTVVAAANTDFTVIYQ